MILPYYSFPVRQEMGGPGEGEQACAQVQAACLPSPPVVPVCRLPGQEAP